MPDTLVTGDNKGGMFVLGRGPFGTEKGGRRRWLKCLPSLRGATNLAGSGYPPRAAWLSTKLTPDDGRQRAFWKARPGS